MWNCRRPKHDAGVGLGIMWKEAVVGCCFVLEWYFCTMVEENQENPWGCLSAEIRTGDFPNTNLECWRLNRTVGAQEWVTSVFVFVEKALKPCHCFLHLQCRNCGLSESTARVEWLLVMARTWFRVSWFSAEIRNGFLHTVRHMRCSWARVPLQELAFWRNVNLHITPTEPRSARCTVHFVMPAWIITVLSFRLFCTVSSRDWGNYGHNDEWRTPSRSVATFTSEIVPHVYLLSWRPSELIWYLLLHVC